MFKFKYHPDGFVIRNSGASCVTFNTFISENPHFPIIRGHYFEYKNDGTFEEIRLVNNTYSHFVVDIENHKLLIEAINNLA